MRWISVLLATLLACSAFGFAQEALQPKPALPQDVLGPQLIAWSQLQKPQPMPQPLPPPEKADQNSAQQQNGPATDSQTQQQPSAQVFTGTIVKDSGRYVLKAVDGAAYELDDQNKAKRYEGKQVKVAGSLDPGGNVLHITTIELIS